MDEQEIEDYLSQTTDATPSGYGTKLQLKQHRADKAYDYARAKGAINKVNAFANVAKGVGNRFPNDSVYDKGISIYDLDKGINTYRDSQQSDVTAVANAAVHFGTAALSTMATTQLLTNPYGWAALGVATIGQAIYNATDDIDNDDPITWLTDNVIFKTMGAAKELVDENTPVYDKAADNAGQGLLASTGWKSGLDQLASGLGYMLGGQWAARGAAAKLGPGKKFYDTINKAVGGKGLGLTAEAMSKAGSTAAAEAAQIAKAKKFTDGVTGFASTLIGRTGESVMESQGTRNEMLANGYSEEEANDAANMNFLANMALSLPDYIQNVKMLGTFDKVLGKASTAGKFSKSATSSYLAGLTKVGKYDKAIDIVKAFGENMVLEGGEEGIQYATNKGAQDTIANRDANYSDKNIFERTKDDYFNFLGNATNEFGQSFVTEEGQMSWILGGLLGGGMTALHTAKTYDTPKQLAQIWKAANDLKTDLDVNYKVNETGLYKEYKTPDGKTQKVINQDYIDTINSNSHLESIKQYALGKNDQPLFESAKNKQILNQALFHLSIDDYDNFIGQLKKTDASPDEIKAMKAFQENKKISDIKDITDEDVQNYKKESDKAVALAEDFKKSYETALDLPGFQNLSKPAMMKFANILSSQKAIDAELKNLRPELMPALEEYSKTNTEVFLPKDTKKTKSGELDKRVKANKEAIANQALTTALDTLVDPIEKAKLTEDYHKYKELNVANKQLIEEYKQYLSNPQKLETQAIQQQLEQFKAAMQDKIAVNNKLKELNAKLKVGQATENHAIHVDNGDGTTSQYTIVNDNGVMKLINMEDGTEADPAAVLSKAHKVAPTSLDPADFQPEEEDDDPEKRETKNWMQEKWSKLKNFFSSTGSIWRMTKTGDKELDENNEYVINSENEEFFKFMANPENTPGMIVDGKEKVYSWQLDVSVNVDPQRLQVILDEVNARRAKSNYLAPLTLEDLKSNPAYQLIKMTLYEGNKAVQKNGKGITCFMHDLDYFDKTAEHEKIVEDDTLNAQEKADKITKAKERLLKQRANIIKSIMSVNAPMYAPVVSKSNGVLSRLPMINNKQQSKNIIGRVVKNIKSLIEHKSLLPDSNGAMKLMPGLGTVKSVVENTDGTFDVTVNYVMKDSKGYKTETFNTADRFFPSQLVFNDVTSNGTNKVIKPFINNALNEEDMNGIIDALYHFVKNQKNTFTVGDKEYNIFSKFLVKDDVTKGAGVLDSIMNIYGKKVAFSSKKRIDVTFEEGKYILKLGGKRINPDSITKEDLKKFFTDNYPKGLKYQLKNYSVHAFDKGFVFPKSINDQGVAEVSEHPSYLNFLFDGDSPRIGTDVSKDFKFANAYMTLGMSGEDVILGTKPFTSNIPQEKEKAESTAKKPNVKKKSNPLKASKEEDIIKRIIALDPKILGELTPEERIYFYDKVNSPGISDFYGMYLEDVFKYLSENNLTNSTKSILDTLAENNPDEYNKFISKLTFTEFEPIRPVEDVKEEECATEGFREINPDDFGGL